MAKFDLGLTWKEFSELTPSMFAALRKRKTIAFRYQCFATAIVAADNRNCHRSDSGDRVWRAEDYVIGEDDLERDPEREQIKQNIASAYALMMSARKPISPKEREPLSLDEMKAWRKKIVRDLINQGWSLEDADTIFDESLTRE